MQRPRHATPSTLFGSVGLACEPEDDPPFCFRCEQLFPNRKWLEDHLCPAMTYICTCGTEFSVYMDMMEHSREHEPGHSVLHHASIQKQRMEMQKRAKEQLMRQPTHMRQGFPSQGFPPFPQVRVPSTPMPIGPSWQSAHKPKVPTTVDLWALYQPIVLMNTLRRFDKGKPYQCATCDQGFSFRNELIRHHSAHVQERVIGCLLCGALLPTNKLVSQRHVCPASAALMGRITTTTTITNTLKARLTTVPPLSYNKSPVAHANKFALPRGAQANSLLKHQVIEGFRCSMCHVSFQSINVLQRHKCPVAVDYVKRQALVPNNHKSVKRATGPYVLPQNNVNRQLKINVQASRGVQAYPKAVGPNRPLQVPAVLVNKGVDSEMPAIRVNKDVDSDDDCYLIESSSSESTQLLKNTNDISPLPVIQT